MENRGRYFYLEYLLTLLLFLPLLFFFPKEASPLRIYLFTGIIIGAGAAYISRDRFYPFRRSLTLTASLLILLGTLYFVFKSTFLYREVIVICIKSLSILIVVNSLARFRKGT